MPGAAGDSADAEYLGLWHVDGHRERVVAVVLYYYHVDELRVCMRRFFPTRQVWGC